MLPPVLHIAFPDLEADGGAVIHPPDPAYNCVAWAAGVTDTLWWPADPDGYWPPGVPDELTLATVGYALCADDNYELGSEKAAVYTRGGIPTHVARQLSSGRWSSKLGRDYLVSHATPNGVEGTVYGSVAMYLRRPAP